MQKLTELELRELLSKNLPFIDQHDEIIERVGYREVRIRLPFRQEYLGADVWRSTGCVIYSGPIIMGLADTAMFGCIHGTVGRDIVAVIVTLTITFLRPAAAADLIAEARILRCGKRLVYLETYLYSDEDAEPIGHVISTYAIRNREQK